jgi:hypothetical protein
VIDQTDDHCVDRNVQKKTNLVPNYQKRNTIRRRLEATGRAAIPGTNFADGLQRLGIKELIYRFLIGLSGPVVVVLAVLSRHPRSQNRNI